MADTEGMTLIHLLLPTARAAVSHKGASQFGARKFACVGVSLAMGSRLAVTSTAALVLIMLSLLTPSANAANGIDGKEAPDFALRTLEQANLRLSEFRGQVVLINFWASWCGECRQAMPALNDIYEKYQRAGLVMLSVNVDDEAQRASRMAQSLNIRFPVLFDDHKSVARLYQVDTMPMTLMIDREGIVRFVHVGYNSGDVSKFLPPLRALLNE